MGGRLLAASLSALIHAALLAALLPPSDPLPEPALVPPVLITLQGRSGGAPSPAAPEAAAANPAQEPSAPDSPAPPPVPEPSAAAPVSEPSTAPADPAASPFDSAEELLPTDAESPQPRYDAEPDPAVTGDVASVVASGAAGLPPGVDCPLVGQLRQALQNDGKVQASLARVPRRHRSVANAVMLWDGRWASAEQAGGQATIDTVRRAIATTLREASETCRAQIVLGPVFLPLDGPSGTMVLTLGSGAWRWTDLLSEAALDSPGPTWWDLARRPAAAK